MKIFIVEDDISIRDELSNLLEKYGYISKTSDDFINIVDEILNFNSDLILLDVNLPHKDGYELCREIRLSSDVPIIMLTSKNTDLDELFSLNMGADDFITKPYNSQVLLARIERLLERTNKSQQSSILKYEGVELDLRKAKLKCDSDSVELTSNELNILRLLMESGGNIITRDDIINELWQDGNFIDENTLNVNIVRLRKKLSEIGLDDFIKTKRGIGYYL